MSLILNRKLPLFVFFFLLLALLPALAGCSADPRLEASRAIERTNEEISAHDKLFNEARSAYSGPGPPGGGGSTTEGEEAGPNVSEARETLEEARSRLQNAEEEVSGIRDLKISGGLLDYSRTLEEALGDQIRGEEREIAFYEILSRDPNLEDNRDRAVGLLSGAEEAYTQAEDGYESASRIADSNPELFASESG